MKVLRKGIRPLILAAALALGTAVAATAGNPLTTIPKSPVGGSIIKGPVPKLCPDIRVWSNYQLMPHREFPYETSCKECWLTVGVLNMEDMALWVENAGGMNMPATAARMTWMSGKPPYRQRSVVVTIPALRAGERKFITIHVPNNEFFQVAQPIKLELDYRHAVRECNENNNVSIYRYH